MNGQLYQECEHYICHTEPVCSVCMYCEAHCQCPTDDEVETTRHQRKAAAAIKQGYDLMAAYIREFGETVKNPTGKVVTDTRTFHIGAGYGPGLVFTADMAGVVYLVDYTGSDVDEWAANSYIMPEINAADGDLHTNTLLVRALERLNDNKALTRQQRRTFAV